MLGLGNKAKDCIPQSDTLSIQTNFKILMSANPATATVLIIDDDAEIRYSLNRVLSSREYRVLVASGGKEGIEIATKEKPAVVFLDNRMEGMTGLETLQHLRSASPHSMVILMTAYGTTQTAIEAMKFGAFDYIIKPFDIKKVLSLAAGAAKANADLVSSQAGYEPIVNSEDYKEGIVGSSEAMREVFKKIGQVAASDVTVMITGESGTGKELVARCIWQHSLRSSKPFMAVNCAAIPDNLIESELFGHEKGSFTGATNQRMGKWELCDGGTLFLDEIGDMALPTQTKILRAIQEGEIQRVGGEKTIKVNVRLIAATNKNLEQMVAEKTFREDLYYRLNVMRIRLPALRERSEDIPALTDFMLQRLGKERKTRIRHMSADAMGLMVRYPWPGNVRELENVVHRSAVVAQGEMILPKDLPQELREYQSTKLPVGIQPDETLETIEPEITPSSVPTGLPEVIGSPPAKSPSKAPFVEVVSEPQKQPAQAGNLNEIYDVLYKKLRAEKDENILEAIELAMIERSLSETGGNQVRSATILGITRATLRKRIDEFNLKY